jgi:DNA-binding NarL/FixJ family response regulator
VVDNEINVRQEISNGVLKTLPLHGIADQKSPLEQLTNRRREILQLIAEGRNTKQIAEILKVSPKTVEYHRMKLMDCLNIHDVAGLVRFAMQAGLFPQEKLVAGLSFPGKMSPACPAGSVKNHLPMR